MTFQLCCCSTHGPELLFFMSFFDLTGEVSWSKMEKVMMSTRAWRTVVQVGRWWMWLQLLCPRGKSAAAGRDVALPHNTSPQVLASSWYLLLSGLAAVASLAAVHTLWECSAHFYASPLLFCLIPTYAIPLSFSVKFWSVALNSQLFFFKNRLQFVPWCLFQTHSEEFCIEFCMCTQFLSH